LFSFSNCVFLFSKSLFLFLKYTFLFFLFFSIFKYFPLTKSLCWFCKFRFLILNRPYRNFFFFLILYTYSFNLQTKHSCQRTNERLSSLHERKSYSVKTSSINHILEIHGLAYPILKNFWSICLRYNHKILDSSCSIYLKELWHALTVERCALHEKK